ncbi:hypothetical protein [Rhodocyclus tenuis]|uniref:Uncharacterized protein n=1 Tax=Rhodocyclus tenuis TaxID=1066 RepID=A0A840G6G5_RHOTE|nr:hypothetical protein [Rhodocyclus tenuis]MBB4246991.1 hypothetical protein [Rhodocyclus tenuis]
MLEIHERSFPAAAQAAAHGPGDCSVFWILFIQTYDFILTNGRSMMRGTGTLPTGASKK